MDDQTGRETTKPTGPVHPVTLPEVAERLLSRISEEPMSSEVVLGGGIALKHYADFRATQDIDAWWRSRRNPDALNQIKAAVEAVALERGLALVHRHFGATDSLELTDPETSQRRFSFQIAERDVSIDQPLMSSWPPILIETLNENIGAKMNALVNRGAPRDFLDIYEVAKRGLISAQDCWKLWELKNPGRNVDQAKTDVIALLERIAHRRPLGAMSSEERDSAAPLRDWFFSVFCRH